MTTPRINSLDGIRAVAIVQVTLLHLGQNTGWTVAKFFSQGQDGVGLFFILSGFLVTTLLLREQEKTGSIRIRHFYFRRAMRILPPAFFYTAILIIGAPLFAYQVHLSTVASVIFFCHNWLGFPMWQFDHFWSLAVEEQFYLLWPLILVPCLLRSKTLATYVCAALWLLAPVLRIAGYLLHSHMNMRFLLPTRMDTLLAGCMLALLADTPKFEALMKKLSHAWLPLMLALFVVIPLLALRIGPRFYPSIGYSLFSLIGAWFVLWSSRLTSGIVYGALNHKAMLQIGVMSYSLYLWQTLFTMGLHTSLTIGLGMVALAAVATFSYRFVERWALLKRKSIEQRGWMKKLAAPRGRMVTDTASL